MMKHYKDENDNVYGFNKDGSQDEFIKPNFVLITDKEMRELTKVKEVFDPEFNRLLIKEKIREASEIIDTLKDLIEFGQAKEGDNEKLLAWRNYRVAVIQLDPNNQELEWPEVP